MKLEAMSISFQYGNGNKRILSNVSIGLENGERVGLTTPSGFGKATFCKILVGYRKPDHGTVMLGGRGIFSCTGYNPVRMIWQHPELSVNPRLKMREVPRRGDFVKEQVARGLGIEPDQLNRYPGELSGEELQWFCIAGTLGEHTRFILADEVSAILNLITQSRIWGLLLEEVRTRDLGLLVVNYSEELLERVCGRVADLKADQGRSGRMICIWKDWKRDDQAVWI